MTRDALGVKQLPRGLKLSLSSKTLAAPPPPHLSLLDLPLPPFAPCSFRPFSPAANETLSPEADALITASATASTDTHEVDLGDMVITAMTTTTTLPSCYSLSSVLAPAFSFHKIFVRWFCEKQMNNARHTHTRSEERQTRI